MLRAKYASSTSLGTSALDTKIKEKERLIHLAKLKEIRNQTGVQTRNPQHKAMKKQLRKYKSASHKVQSFFDTTQQNKKAMVDHIISITRRKSQHGLSMKSLSSHRSQKEEQAKQIKKQNKKLIMAILEQKSQIKSRRELKKQFQIYEEQRDKIRKVK